MNMDFNSSRAKTADRQRLRVQTDICKKRKEFTLFFRHTGFVVADLLVNRSMRFRFYEYRPSGIIPVFNYTESFPPPTFQMDSVYTVRYDYSVMRSIHPKYDLTGKFHRKLFGENYRKEWAVPTRLPLIRISTFQGGLTPLQRGGGMQSNSLRLVDKNGNEWVIRSVEKTVDQLLPEALRSTFARDFLDDVTSGQHPFSACCSTHWECNQNPACQPGNRRNRT
jgi:hypothetical protein